MKDNDILSKKYRDVNGNICINGKLYITDDLNINLLSEHGTMIFAKDCIFSSKKEDVILTKNDVFVEDLFNKIKVKNIVLI